MFVEVSPIAFPPVFFILSLVFLVKDGFYEPVLDFFRDSDHFDQQVFWNYVKPFAAYKSHQIHHFGLIAVLDEFLFKFA